PVADPGPSCPADAPECGKTTPAGTGGTSGAGNASGSGVGGGTGTAQDAISVDPTIAASIPSTCQPSSCATNSDCAADMVCHTDSYSECSGGTAPACPPNTKCDDVAVTPAECTTKTISMCVYPWQ